MEIIIVVIIAVGGWIITHALTIRAQNRNFINQVVNDARLKITRTVRDYQDWLGKVHITILTSSFDVICQERGVSVNWLQKIAELEKLFYSDRRILKWVFCLEEYEILFPKTAECRKDLLDRQRQIQKYLSSFLQELRSDSMEPPALKQRIKAIEKAKNNVGIVVDQLALMKDLRIYLQNLCLGSFTGNKIPERKPKNLSLPRLVQDKRGNLQVIVTQNTTKKGGG